MEDRNEHTNPGCHVTIDPVTLSEVASMAKLRIKKEVWDYYQCGADSQTALYENEAAFKA
jgi:(S)-2-hydroxy-acid oxidase